MLKFYTPITTFLFFAILPQFLQAQWTKTNGLPGGNTTNFINYGDTVLASVGNELYFSINQGDFWSPIVNPSYGGINVLSNDDQNVFGYAYDRTTQNYIWFRTDDFFQTLHPVFIPDTLNLREFFLAYGYLYASEYDNFNAKLYRSDNDGISWEFVAPLSPNEVEFDGQRITGYSYPYILQSTDEGFSWDTLLQFSGNIYQMLKNENNIFVINTYPNSIKGCYSSNDYGQSWQFYPNDGLDKFFRYFWHNERIYGLDGDRMIQSADYGQSWDIVSLPSNSAYAAHYAISSANALIIGGMQSVGSSGLYRSFDNGDTWSPLSLGIMTSSGKLRKVNNDLFVPSSGGLYKVQADQVNWTKIDLPIPQPPNHYWIISDFVQTGNNWVLSDGQNLWVSQDQGNTWLKSWVEPGFSGLPADLLELENVGNKVIAHGPWQGYDDYYYYISEDNGLTFHFLETLFEQKHTKIGLLEVTNDMVYALGHDLKIYHSDDGCATWTLQSDNSQASGCGIPDWDVLAGSLQVSNNVIAVNADYFKKIHFSKDAGQNWTCNDLESASSTWGNSIITDLLHVGNHLLAATQNGIYVSENDGTDWADWNDGLFANDITDIETHNGFLWAAAKGGGIWKRPLIELGMSPTLDPGFLNTLLQLSPNPASSLVTIQIGDGSGELSIIDGMGRVVLHQIVHNAEATFSVERLPEGYYQVIFVGEKILRHSSLIVLH